MKELISYEIHHSGNYLVHYKKQSIIVLPNAFRSATGVSDQATIGTVEVDDEKLKQIGFVVKE